MMTFIFDWTDFLVKLLAIMGLFFVAGIVFGIGVLGLIIRDERRERRREIEAHKEEEKAMWAEVDRILAQGYEGGDDHVSSRS